MVGSHGQLCGKALHCALSTSVQSVLKHPCISLNAVWAEILKHVVLRLSLNICVKLTDIWF